MGQQIFDSYAAMLAGLDGNPFDDTPVPALPPAQLEQGDLTKALGGERGLARMLKRAGFPSTKPPTLKFLNYLSAVTDEPPPDYTGGLIRSDLAVCKADSERGFGLWFHFASAWHKLATLPDGDEAIKAMRPGMVKSGASDERRAGHEQRMLKQNNFLAERAKAKALELEQSRARKKAADQVEKQQELERTAAHG